MASPCDLVQDALTIGDALAFAVAQNVPSDNTLLIHDAAKMAVAMQLSDALVIGDAVVQMWTHGVSDHLTIGDHIQQHLVTVSLVSDALTIGDSSGAGIVSKVSDALTIHDAVALGLAHGVADHLTVIDAVQQITATVSLVRDVLTIADAIQSGFVSLVADSLTINDAINQRMVFVSLIGDSLTIHDSALGTAPVVQLVSDGLTIHDAIRQALVAVQLVSDSLVIEDRVSGGASGAWTAHVEPFAMSRYAGFGFNSLASVAGFLLAAGDGGVYVVAGDTDAGTQIAARVEHDLSDDVPDARGEMHNDENHKRPRYLYASYRSPGQIAVEIGYVDENDTGGGWVERKADYTLPAMNASQFRNGRVALGRGIRSRYLRPVLMNVSGANFAMNDASLMVDSIKRKV